MRHECAKSLWKFAAKTLDDEGASNISPAFSSQEAEVSSTTPTVAVPHLFSAQSGSPSQHFQVVGLMKIQLRHMKYRRYSGILGAHPPPALSTKYPPNLIDFTLQHYHAPHHFRDVVVSLYSNLSAVVTSKSWATNPIQLQVGVYQGDPLSVAIFSAVMTTLADTIDHHKHLGYQFTNSPRSTNILQYADDTCLIADGPSSCQQLLKSVEKWLQWTGMKAKMPKCHSLAIWEDL